MSEPSSDKSIPCNIISNHCFDIKDILIIEDSNSLSKLLKTSIENINNIDCDIVTTEQEAKNLISKKKYDLIIADLILPDSSGNLVGWLIRHKQRLLIMTSSSNDEIRKRLVELSIIDYLYKIDELTFIRSITDTLTRLQNNKNSLAVVCDDSKLSRRYIVEVLKTQNIPYIEFEDGKQAYTYVSKHSLNVDILISDYEMPHMDGLELTRRLRLHNSALELPIIILSGSNKQSLVANILKMGANDYISKPLAREEFISRFNTVLNHSRLFKENAKLIESLELAAMSDFLTGLYNRNYLYANVEHVIAEAKRSNKSYAIILFDIDNFKSINDTYGHDVGDQVLKKFSLIMKSSARESDIVCRWGGEEFIILSSNTIEEATNLSERIREAIESYIFKFDEFEENISITVSSGIAAGTNDDIDNIIKKADERLYIAKTSGKNRVVWS